MFHYFVAKHFKKQIKPYLKKHPNLITDIINLLKAFSPKQNTALGAHIFKLRLKSSNIPKGKNKSFRLIILFYDNKNLIIPITLYFKGIHNTISQSAIKKHIDIINQEMKNFG